jgi:hyperosmotically inducible protein
MIDRTVLAVTDHKIKGGEAVITPEVKAKLLANCVTRGLSISVQTFKGAVTLIGAAETEHQKTTAAKIARSVVGVKKVNNLVTVNR